MKKLMEKMLAILMISILIMSSMLLLGVYAQSAIDTEAFLNAMPNPVEVGTSLTLTGWVTPPPPAGEIFTGLAVTIIHPDGTREAAGPFTSDSDGYFSFVYVPNSLGEWGFQLTYPGETFPASYYNPSVSSVLVVSVQEAPIYIPPGQDITVYPHPDVILTFDEVLTGGTVYVTPSYDPPPGYPLEGIGPYYYIETNPLTFTAVSIGIRYDDSGLTPEQENELTLWRFDPGGLVEGDVNNNGKVDFVDLLIVVLSLGSSPGQRRWKPECDLNNDLKVNLLDLYIVFRNFGQTSTIPSWINITTYIDTVSNVAYGDTDHFSPYRIH